jgi:hypothetical protein
MRKDNLPPGKRFSFKMPFPTTSLVTSGMPLSRWQKESPVSGPEMSDVFEPSRLCSQAATITGIGTDTSGWPTYRVSPLNAITGDFKDSFYPTAGNQALWLPLFRTYLPIDVR